MGAQMSEVPSETKKPGKFASIQNGIASMAGILGATGAVGGACIYLLSPRIDKYIEDVVRNSKAGAIVVQSTAPTPVTLLPDNKPAPDNKQAADSKQVDDLRHQVETLTKAVNEIRARASFNAPYGYSFRFKGAEIIAQQRPLSRLYFYATRDDEVKVTVYLATQKFPVTMKVDGVAVRPTIRDSKDSLRVTDFLIHTSLEEVMPVGNGDAKEAGGRPAPEDPRPQNVHYIEFVPGDVTYNFGKNDDYDVSGIVLVSKKNI